MFGLIMGTYTCIGVMLIMELKDRLRKLRSEKGITQEEFGKLFGVIKQTVSSWENGNSKPDVGMIVDLAQFFNITTDYLLGTTDSPRSMLSGEISRDHPDPEVVKLLTDEGVQKLKLTKDVSLDELKEIIEFAKRIKKQKTDE